MDPFTQFMQQKMVPPGAQVIPPPQSPMGGMPPGMAPQAPPMQGDNPFMQWLQAQQGGGQGMPSQMPPPMPQPAPQGPMAMPPQMGGMPPSMPQMAPQGGSDYGSGVAAARRLLGMM